MKLNLGCGNDILPDFVNCDRYDAACDVCCDAKNLPFKTNSIDEIYASHLIEHFNFFEAFEVLREWKRVLKPGGILRIETPDMEKSCEAFLKATEQQRLRLYYHFFSEPWVSPGQIHKFLYTETQLHWTLQCCGFNSIQTFPAKRYTDVEHVCLGMSAQK